MKSRHARTEGVIVTSNQGSVGGTNGGGPNKVVSTGEHKNAYGANTEQCVQYSAQQC